MSIDVSRFLAQTPPFSELTAKERAPAAERAFVITQSAGAIISVQGRTRIDNVWVIREGALRLYYDRDGQRTQERLLEAGEIFGGISILVNSAYSVRTVAVDRDSTLVGLPAEVFRGLCDRHRSFRQFFMDIFRNQMEDESYAAIIAANQAIRFMSGVTPFSFLPQEELEAVALQLQRVRHPADIVLFAQGRSKLDHLHIVIKGAAERYYEEKDKKTLRAVISEGDLYGGISILMNEGLAVRTLKTIEETDFYQFPTADFLDLCGRNSDFAGFFSDTFGKRMMDRTYAQIIAQSMRPREEALHFFNRPVSSFYNANLVTCDRQTPIQQAAAAMSRRRCSSIFVTDADGGFAGIVTDNDLRRKVIAQGYGIDKPVADIMSSPLKTIPAQAQIFETLMVMMQENVKHLAVADTDGKVVGVVSNRDLLTAQGKSPFFLVRELTEADSLDTIIEKHRQMPELIQSLIQSGAKADNVTRFITAISDTILTKLATRAIREMGAPPARFAFMILGSEGRREQTLKTDQDNAIVYEDVPEQRHEAVREYFLAMGKKVCGWLDQVGYAYCEGGIMAQNPQWCQPLSAWKHYFSGWIHTAEAEDLLQASIFFDFRLGHGDKALVDNLRQYLFGSLKGWSGFFRHMTENALHFKPPLGFFRNFVVESKGEHRNKLDIKSAMQPIVDMARIYALNNAIAETNTLERLHQLYIRNALTWEEYNEMQQGYGFLLQVRFMRQVTAALEEKAPPDNYINPKSLSNIEQTMLKEIFKRIEKFQSKLNFDFIGII